MKTQKMDYVKKIMESKSTEELAKICREKDTSKYSEETLEVVQRILKQRGDLSSASQSIRQNKGESSLLMKCKDCGKEVSRRADKCPNCGAPIKKRSRVLAGGISTIIVLILVLIVIGTLGKSKRGLQKGEKVAEEVAREIPKQTLKEVSKGEFKGIPIKEYADIRDLTSAYRKMTEVQQKNWSEENQWRYYVTGSGKVSEVEYAGLISEIKGDYYEVTVELVGGNRAVVFYPKTEQYSWIMNIAKGSNHEFKGRLKNMKSWRFWISGYVMGEQ